MDERRNEQRRRTLHGGKIIFNDRRSVIDCLVRNLSDNGTCLQLNSTVGIPTTFDLLIDGEQASRPCQLIWLSDNRVVSVKADAVLVRRSDLVAFGGEAVAGRAPQIGRS
jgi:hypothetical protein